jgi:hypothetical protein
MSPSKQPTPDELLAAGARIVALEHRRDTLEQAGRDQRTYRRERLSASLLLLVLFLAVLAVDQALSPPEHPEQIDAAALAAVVFAGVAIILTFRPEPDPGACVSPDDAAQLAGYIYVRIEEEPDKNNPQDGFRVTKLGERAREAFCNIDPTQYT